LVWLCLPPSSLQNLTTASVSSVGRDIPPLVNKPRLRRIAARIVGLAAAAAPPPPAAASGTVRGVFDLVWAKALARAAALRDAPAPAPAPLAGAAAAP